MTFTDYEHGPGCTLGERGQQCAECRLRYGEPHVVGTEGPTPENDPMGRFTADLCGVCGRLIGFGVPALHLGLCETCRDAKES